MLNPDGIVRENSIVYYIYKKMQQCENWLAIIMYKTCLYALYTAIFSAVKMTFLISFFSESIDCGHHQ